MVSVIYVCFLGIYFVKKEKVAFTKDNMREKCVMGDVSQIPLEHLSPVVDEVRLHFFIRIIYRNTRVSFTQNLRTISASAGKNNLRTQASITHL